MARTPDFLEATPVGALSAQLSRLRSRSAMSASRRHETSPHVSNAQIAVMSGRRPVVKGRFEPALSAPGSGHVFGLQMRKDHAGRMV